MLLTIHDANLKKVAFIDNEKQNTLHYFDDVWTRNKETGSSTFEFTVLKKPTDKTYNYLNEFQSTHPCGVRLSVIINDIQLLIFHSTPPCGVRLH